MPKLTLADLAPLLEVIRTHHARGIAAAFAASRDHVGLTESQMPFDPKRPAIKRILEKTAERITGIADETIDRVNAYIQIGLDGGETPAEIADRIEADASGAFSAARASTIARTETATVYNWGSIAGYRESGRVERVRIFDGDGCVLPGQKWLPVGEPAALWRGDFDGDALTLTWIGAGDVTHRLAVSPNHPILTGQGWKRAKFFREGDNLIYCQIGDDPVSLTHSQVDDVPTIEESFEACRGNTVMVRPYLPGDLHEDGTAIKGEVRIVRPNAELLDERHVTLFEKARELALMWPDRETFALARQGYGDAFLSRLGAAGGGLVGSGNLGQLPRVGETVPLNAGVLGGGTSEAKAGNKTVDGMGTTPETRGNGDGAKSLGYVEIYNFIPKWNSLCLNRAGEATVAPGGIVSRAKRGAADLANSNASGASSTLSFHYGTILSVEVAPYRGPVYDVSAEGYYSIDGAILKNCGWTSHDDPDAAHGSIRDLDDFEEYPISHPNCVRAGAPFIDLEE